MYMKNYSEMSIAVLNTTVKSQKQSTCPKIVILQSYVGIQSKHYGIYF